MIQTLLAPSTFAACLRLATPILLAAIGGSFTYHTNVFNIALEGFMLIACFFSAWATIIFGSPLIGIIAGILTGIFSAMIFALMVIIFKSNNIVVGLAINLGATGLTTWLLLGIFNTRGYVLIENGGFPNIKLPIISNIPYISEVLSNQNILVYLAFLLAIIGEFFFFKNIYGIRLRAIGESPEASQSVGINVLHGKLTSILFSGFFCGISGSFLTLSGASMFSEGMTAGTGFIALAVVYFSSGRPWMMIISSLLFGYTYAISVTLQQFKIPSQLMLTLPYLMTIIVLTIISIIKKKRKYLF